MTKKAKIRYRLFLVLLLAAAVGGGIWYCYESYQEDPIPEDSVLVREGMDGQESGILETEQSAKDTENREQAA